MSINVLQRIVSGRKIKQYNDCVENIIQDTSRTSDLLHKGP